MLERPEEEALTSLSRGAWSEVLRPAVRQNILSTIMLKNVKLSYGDVRFCLATAAVF